MKQGQGKLEQGQAKLEQGQAKLEQDVANASSRLGRLEQEVAAMKTDIAAIKEDIEEIKYSVLETRSTVNAIAEWADNAEHALKLPLPAFVIHLCFSIPCHCRLKRSKTCVFEQPSVARFSKIKEY